MSVSTPIVQTWDGATRRIYLKQGVSDFYPIEDIYHEYRNQRRLDEDLRKFEPLLKAEGNVPKGGGAFTPRYVVLLDGTKVVPYDETLQVNQLGDMITDDPDVDPTLYDTSTLTVPKVIYIKPSEAEIIQLNSDAIQYSSYSGGVTIDETDGFDGTDYPIGTPMKPVKTMDDMVLIRENQGVPKVGFIIGDLSITEATPVLDQYTFIGQGMDRTLLDIEPLANVHNCAYLDAHVTGTLDGDSRLEQCLIDNLNYIKGYIQQCVLSAGTITLGGGETAHFLDCWSGVPGSGTPIIDMGGSGQGLALRNYNGGIKLTNKTGSDAVSIDLNSGQCVLSSTVTNGEIVCRGVGKLIDENGDDIHTGTWNGATILNETVSTHTITEGVWEDSIAQSIDIMIQELHKLQGLKSGSPMTVTPSSRQVDDIDLEITGDGETSSTVTRQ